MHCFNILTIINHQHLFIGHFEVLVLCIALVTIKVFHVNSQSIIPWNKKIKTD